MPVSVRRALLGLAHLSLIATDAVAAQTSGVAPAEVADSVIRFTATDGAPLEAKLSLPAGAKGPAPVVFLLHGAGPRNYDHTLRYRDSTGQIRTYRYYDFHASELAKRGLAFFRMSKRRVTSDSLGRPAVDRAVFSKATPNILLDDYARALDSNGDSTITQEELASLNRQRLDAILAAVEQRSDDRIWQAVLNLSSAYLLEDWSGEPTSTMLLKLSVPLAIFHGELDGATCVEGVRETESAFRATGQDEPHRARLSGARSRPELDHRERPSRGHGPVSGRVCVCGRPGAAAMMRGPAQRFRVSSA